MTFRRISPLHSKFVPCKSIVGLYERLPSLEIKFSKGELYPGGGQFALASVDCPGGHCTLVQNVWGSNLREDILHDDICIVLYFLKK